MSAVVTLPPVPREVPELDADPAGIREYAADLLAASTQVDELGSFVAGDARIADWTGLGATAYHDAIRPTGRLAWAPRCCDGRWAQRPRRRPADSCS